MKKMFVLASLALVGVACSKSDDNGGGNGGGNSGENNPVTPTTAPAVYPTEKRGNDQNYTQTTYTLENNKVKTIVTETYQNGVKDATATRTTNVTYTDKKYPTVVEETYNGSFTNKTEYTYNEKNQITEMKNTREGSTQVVKFEYNAEGKLSKAIHSSHEITYEYPNATTVVEKNSSEPNSTNTYTVVNGNVTKFLQERKDDLGTVRFTSTQEYEYNTAVKNPDFSLERRILDPSYFYNYNPYDANYSKNVYTKRTDSYNDNGHSNSRTSTYTYEANDKGYPTKKTEIFEGGNTVTTYTY